METKSLIWWDLDPSFSQTASYYFILEQWLEQTLQNSFRTELGENPIRLLWLNLTPIHRSRFRSGFSQAPHLAQYHALELHGWYGVKITYQWAERGQKVRLKLWEPGQVNFPLLFLCCNSFYMFFFFCSVLHCCLSYIRNRKMSWR